MFANINWLPWLVAVIAQMILGNIWYAKAVFGQTWMQLAGVNQEACKQNGMAKPMIGMVLSTMIMSYVMTLTTTAFGATTFWDGVTVGWWIWLGFVATIMLGDCLWSQKPLKLFAIGAGYYLVGLMLMGGILAGW